MRAGRSWSRGLAQAVQGCARGARVLVLLPFLAILAGCYTDPAVVLDRVDTPAVFDARLLGTWHTPAGAGDAWPPATLEIRAVIREDFRGYEIVAPWYFTRPAVGQLFELDGHRILQVRVPVGSADLREHVEAWHFVGIEVDGNRLRASLLSMHLGDLLDRGGGMLSAIHVPGLWVLTGSPDDALRAAARRVKPAWVIHLER